MINGKLKILLLADAGSFHTERFSNQLKKMGIDVFTVSMEKGSIADITLRPIGPFKFLHYILAKEQLKKIIEQFEPDIISAHYASGYGFLVSLFNRSIKIPVALSLWGSDIFIVPKKSYLHKWKTRRALKSADLVIGDSKYLLDEASKLADIKNKKRIFWGIEENYLSFHKTDYSLSDPFKIIVPRHHEDVYNNIFIVDALKDLINSGKVAVTFPSFGSKMNEFRKKTKMIVNDKINYYEKMNREDFLSFMSNHDLFLSASKSDSSPVSLIEAMALGLIPVVASYPGVEDLIKDNEFLFEQNRHDSLLDVINNILSFKSKLEDVRYRNLQFVKENAIFRKNIEQHLELFLELINRKDKIV